MKHQVHVATESGIVSTEAVKQIKRLITALARTVDALDAAKNRPRADADDLDTRRRNLMVTEVAKGIPLIKLVSTPNRAGPPPAYNVTLPNARPMVAISES